MKKRSVNRPTLVSILRIDCFRAGISLEDHGDEVTLSSAGGEITERLSLKDACALLGLLRGTRCSQVVRDFGGKV